MRVALKQNAAILVFHAPDEDWRTDDAAVRERRIRRCHRGKRDLPRAQGERRHVRDRSDSERLRIRNRTLDADTFEQTDRGAITGRPKCGAHRHRVGRGVLILGKPRALVGLNRLIDTLDERRGRIPVFDCRRIDERLEGRSGLAFRLQRAVQANARRIAAADNRSDFTRSPGRARTAMPAAARPGPDDRPANAARSRGGGHPRFDVTERADDSGLCCLLHLRVDGRVDAEALLVNGLLPNRSMSWRRDDFLEVQGGRILAAKAVVKRHLLGDRRVSLALGDEAVVAHQAKHHVAAFGCAVEVRRGICPRTAT